MKQVEWLALVAAATCMLAGSPRDARADDAPGYQCKEAAAGTKITATFGQETALRDLAIWVMSFSCKNVVIDAAALAYAPKVVVMAPKPMTPKQAIALFVDAVQATGLVVTQKKDSISVKLGPKVPKNCPAIVEPSVAEVAVPPALPETDFDKLLATGVKKINDTTYEVTREVIDAILANPMAVAKGARIVPSVKNGQAHGFKLYAVRPSSIYAKIGLANGDTVLRVNGTPMDTAEKALDVYTTVRDAKALVLDLERRGTPVTIKITVR